MTVFFVLFFVFFSGFLRKAPQPRLPSKSILCSDMLIIVLPHFIPWLAVKGLARCSCDGYIREWGTTCTRTIITVSQISTYIRMPRIHVKSAAQQKVSCCLPTGTRLHEEDTTRKKQEQPALVLGY